MFDPASLLHHHLYLAIALGGLVEGETVVVLAGLAAHQGYAPWWAVTVFAAGVNALVDQGWFLLGRWRGPALMARFPSLGRQVEALAPRLHAHRRWLVLGLRFSYGLRVAGPVALGMARMPVAEFAWLNGPAALIWSAVFTSLGYAFGMAVIQLLERVRPYEPALVMGLGVVGALAWLVARQRWRQPPKVTPNSRPAP